MPGGKILWNYMKPLFAGKILYTPNNAVTRALVTEANSTFANIASLLRTINSVTESQEALLKGVNGSQSLDDLQVIQIHLPWLDLLLNFLY